MPAPFAHRARYHAQGIEVLRVKQLERVRIGETLPALDLFGNRSKVSGNERKVHRKAANFETMMHMLVLGCNRKRQ